MFYIILNYLQNKHFTVATSENLIIYMSFKIYDMAKIRNGKLLVVWFFIVLAIIWLKIHIVKVPAVIQSHQDLPV